MVSESELIERIQAGAVIEKESEMSPQYKEQLIHLMLMQADSEIAGAFGYVPWIMKAPNPAEMLAVASITRDEVRHGKVVYKLLEDLGVDTTARVKSFDFNYRVDGDQFLADQRAGTDQRVNIFYYPIETWCDFVMFNVLMDRGAGHQLEDQLQCSYGPWRRVMEGIVKEETMHIAHGDTWLKRLGQDPRTHDECQETLNRWWPRIMNIFGRPNTSRNRLYRQYRLKLRDNQEVREAFVRDVAPVIEAAGLTVPEWTPNWSRVPEEAQAAG